MSEFGPEGEIRKSFQDRLARARRALKRGVSAGDVPPTKARGIEEDLSRTTEEAARRKLGY